MDIFSDIANAIGNIAIDFNFETWLLTLFAVWMGIGTAVFLKWKGIVLPEIKRPDVIKAGTIVKMGTVGDFAMGFFISFGFSTAGIAPFFAWSLSTMLAATADWVRKKYEGRPSAIAVLKVEMLELMELFGSDPEKFRAVLREKMGIVEDEIEPDLSAVGEDILDPDEVKPDTGSVVLCESEAPTESEPSPEASVPEG